MLSIQIRLGIYRRRYLSYTISLSLPFCPTKAYVVPSSDGMFFSSVTLPMKLSRAATMLLKLSMCFSISGILRVFWLAISRICPSCTPETGSVVVTTCIWLQLVLNCLLYLKLTYRKTSVEVLEMTFGLSIGEHLCYVITHNVIFSNQKIESFMHCWLRARVMCNLVLL